MKLFSLAFLLALTPALAAQTVPLQLWDHVVGTEILHNATLPEGTDVWIVTRNEARAVRLREGYGDIIAGLPAATRDKLGPGGRTRGTYPRTARARTGYYVLAQLPDGRLFQSYVKTGDAGMQPGYDDVQTGRISMGLVPERVAPRLRAVLTNAPPDVPATNHTAALPDEPLAETPGTPDGVALPAFEQALPDTFSSAPVPLAEVEDDFVSAPSDVIAAEPAEPRAPRGWLWLLGGLLLGAAAAYFGTAAYYERLLRRQRENMMRYVPAPDAVGEWEESARSDVPPFLPTTVAALTEMGALDERENEADVPADFDAPGETDARP